MRKYFIINLKSRLDRWNSMVQQMKYGNISNYERFEAISPTWSTIHLYSENLSPHFLAFFLENHPSFSLGTIGAFWSHRTLWQSHQNQNDPLCVFEDDISFLVPNVDDQITLILSSLKDFDTITFFPNMRAKQIKTTNHLLHRTFPNLFGAYGYCVHPNCINQMLPNLQTIYFPFDIQIKHLQKTSTKMFMTSRSLLNTPVSLHRDSNIFQHRIPNQEKYSTTIHKISENDCIDPPFIYVKKMTMLNVKNIFLYNPCKIIKLYFENILYLFIHHKVSRTNESCEIHLTPEQKENLFPKDK